MRTTFDRVFDRVKTYLGFVLALSFLSACGGSPNPVSDNVFVDLDTNRDRTTAGKQYKEDALNKARQDVRANSGDASSNNDDPYRNNYRNNSEAPASTAEDDDIDASEINLGTYAMFAGIMGGIAFLNSSYSPLGFLFDRDSSDNPSSDSEEDTQQASAVDAALGDITADKSLVEVASQPGIVVYDFENQFDPKQIEATMANSNHPSSELQLDDLCLKSGSQIAAGGETRQNIEAILNFNGGLREI